MINLNFNLPGAGPMGGPGAAQQGPAPGGGPMPGMDGGNNNDMTMIMSAFGLMAMTMFMMQMLNGFMGGGQSPMGQSPGFGGISPMGGGGVEASPLSGFLGDPGSAGGAESVGGPTSTAPLSSQPVNAEGYAFPVAGWDPNKKVDPHHGSHHGAADLMAPRGTPIVAMRGGTVTKVGSGGAGGNTVTIKGDDGNMYYYAHMDGAPSVQQGQQIQAGQPLGRVGDSGNAKGTGTHLHLGVGPSILNGTGPAGGAGSDGFDLTGLLNQVLASGR